MDFESVLNLLENGMKHPLPGKEAQLSMSPNPVDMRRFDPKLPDNHRKGAVLILLYPYKNKAFFPLIKRPVYQGVHSGQIAFPGGKMEEEDGDEVDTALREAWEEVGILPEQVKLIGRMSDLFIPTSNFLVSPVLGYSEVVPDFVPEEKEVARIIQAAVSTLYEPSIRKQKILEFSNNFRLDTPYFEVDQEMVWGATAMILSELLQILENGKS
ncbi:NUDIX hydrolase [Algoriphagus aquimarinus]|uniref:NUDIX domain-containing protein n=1 Tax=Algoriphagus aquimarinus TaxID=237018 RepID=A0A1I1BSH5_9BACT|nr:CoA pyrophosphatase [Algoriphagus aquimarinus]SFB53241.1 NUDIX domain-containing protein [Algoriphagus aquimarinus]|tara:strand:+ start:359333 stop:359971 length:639 start_codon:yes stop_codon:yes gene_type:complete